MIWGFHVSYHRWRLPKSVAGVNPWNALVDLGELHHRLGSPDYESEQTWSNCNLPTIYQAIGGTTNELESKVNCISAKAFKRAIRKREIKENTNSLGLRQKVQEPPEQVEDVAKKYKRKLDLGAIYVWREDMPECIKAVLKEYEDIFPQDLPPGLPPMRMGHEFRIDLQDDMSLVHRSLYKLSLLKLEEAHKQI